MQGDGGRGRQGQRGGSVAEHVQASSGDCCRLPMLREPVGQSLGVDRRAELVAEHEVLIGIGSSRQAALEVLRFVVMAQRVDRRGVEHDCALRTGALGRPEAEEPGLDFEELALDGDGAAKQVDVFAPHPEHLAPADPGVSGEVDPHTEPPG